MNAFQLTGTTPDGKPGHVWACGKCMHACRDEEAAKECCDWKCKECGAETKPYHSQCNRCRSAEWARRDQARIDKAEKLESWYEGVFWNDQYHSCLDDALEAMDDIERPEWICVAKRCPPKLLDAQDILENHCDDMGEDAYDYLHGTKEFAAACDAFNEVNKGIEWFTEDWTRMVKVPPNDLEEEERDAMPSQSEMDMERDATPRMPLDPL